ncbi:MAG: hypothetical protein EZS28_001978 [Streblomastix strix]|uniref:Uncharacterized protein n=1 Tax=Streblomastix strix TaxID=222440 RepID=A0A5J4X5G4_9EUKA|nr:MAG: hypothetical protein EZS28_001978 [Streblomastix strix]
MNDYNVSNLGIDLSKAYFNSNEAYKQYLRRYWTPPILLPITIADGVIEDIQSIGNISKRGGAAIYGEIGDNGSLIIEDTCFTSYSYIENDDGGIYVILNKIFRFETKWTVIFTGCRTNNDTLEAVGGRGGALYIYLAEESTFKQIIVQDTSFTTNEADICDEDIFIITRNMNILNIRTHILFNIITFTNPDNAMYGTEYKLIDELCHIPLIDYFLLERYIYYLNDTMNVSSRKWGGVDTEECGYVNSTCNSFEHAVLKQTTPERTSTNLQCGQKIVYTYISVGEMHVNQPYRTEADIFMLGGATTDEISVATEGGSVYFDGNGEMEFSDQGYWQINKIEGVDYSSIKGVNLKVLFHSINIVLPTAKQAQYTFMLVGTKDYVDMNRNLELTIENWTLTQNNTLDKATNFSLLRTEQFLSLRMNVSKFNFKRYYASFERTGLIEINYERDVFTWDNHLNLVNCSLANISSIMTAKELKEIIGEKDDEQSLDIASILNVRSGSAKRLPIYIYDCQFDFCKCSVEIPAKERRQIGVGCAIVFCGNTLLLPLEHLKLINCSGNVTFTQMKLQYSINRQIIHDVNESNPLNDNQQFFLPQSSKSGTNHHLNQKDKNKTVNNFIKKANYQIEIAGGAYVSLVDDCRGEERFIAKKQLSEYVRKQCKKAEDISRVVDDMSRPWVTFDICITIWCNTSVPVNNYVSSSSMLRVTESGGALVHIDRSAAKCNFQSSIFTDCGITTTPWTLVIFSTNIAPCIGQKSEDDICEPLWDRELRNGKMGTGLVVAREETSPLIKANGIQFINCDGIIKNIYDPTGTVDALLRLMSAQPLERISLSHIYAFFIFTNSSSDEIGEMMYDRNSYISLIHLFDHQDFFFVNRAAISMFNLHNNGSRTRPSTAPHPHYQNMIVFGRIQKLFTLFKKYANQDIKISISLQSICKKCCNIQIDQSCAKCLLKQIVSVTHVQVGIAHHQHNRLNDNDDDESANSEPGLQVQSDEDEDYAASPIQQLSDDEHQSIYSASGDDEIRNAQWLPRLRTRLEADGDAKSLSESETETETAPGIKRRRLLEDESEDNKEKSDSDSISPQDTETKQWLQKLAPVLGKGERHNKKAAIRLVSSRINQKPKDYDALCPELDEDHIKALRERSRVDLTPFNIVMPPRIVDGERSPQIGGLVRNFVAAQHTGIMAIESIFKKGKEEAAVRVLNMFELVSQATGEAQQLRKQNINFRCNQFSYNRSPVSAALSPKDKKAWKENKSISMNTSRSLSRKGGSSRSPTARGRSIQRGRRSRGSYNSYK